MADVQYRLVMRSGVSPTNDTEYGTFTDKDQAFAVGRLLFEADKKAHPEWRAFDIVPIAAVEANRVVVDEALVSVAVEAFLASTGQSHPVTQLQRDLATNCMRAALTAAMAKE